MSSWLRDLAQLLRLGVPPMDAVARVRPELVEPMSQGQDLSDLLPEIVRPAALATDDLPTLLENLAQLEELESEQRHTLKLAALYPGITLFCWVSLALFLGSWMLLLLGLAVGLWWAIHPLFGTWRLCQEQARFFRWLAFFLRQGYTTAQAAPLAITATGPVLWKVGLSTLTESLREGSSLAQALAPDPLAKLVQPEHPEQLERVADLLRRQGGHSFATGAALLEPLALFFLGILTLLLWWQEYPVGGPW